MDLIPFDFSFTHFKQQTNLLPLGKILMCNIIFPLPFFMANKEHHQNAEVRPKYVRLQIKMADSSDK